MEVPIEKFSMSDFTIKPWDKGKCYIVAYYPSLKSDSVYLHKDGTIHNVCGERNFYEKKEAELHLEKTFNYSKPILFDDKDLEIDI